MQLVRGDLCTIEDIGPSSMFSKYAWMFIGKAVTFLEFDPKEFMVVANGFVACTVRAEETIVCPSRTFLRGATITFSSVKLEKRRRQNPLRM